MGTRIKIEVDLDDIMTVINLGYSMVLVEADICKKENVI